MGIKLGLFLPIRFGGGTLRMVVGLAKMLAQARGTWIDRLVFANPDQSPDYIRELAPLRDLGIEIRPLSWRRLSPDAVERMLGAMDREHVLTGQECLLPQDGSYDFTDLDYWLFVSDRILGHILPLRRTGILATDFIQRYVPEIFDADMYRNPAAFPNVTIRNFRNIDDAFATTPATCDDLRSYVGVREPVLLPQFFDPGFLDGSGSVAAVPDDAKPYFLWVTNGSQHKNHLVTIEGLERYYERGGDLECVVTGVNTSLFDPRWIGTPEGHGHHPYHRLVRDSLAKTRFLSRRLTILGNVTDPLYRDALRDARFLLHSVIADNGTYAVVEAAYLGTPSVSSRYPQQEYMNDVYGLAMKFFDPGDPDELATRLLEAAADGHGPRLDRARLQPFTPDRVAPTLTERIRAVATQPRTPKAFHA